MKKLLLILCFCSAFFVCRSQVTTFEKMFVSIHDSSYGLVLEQFYSLKQLSDGYVFAGYRNDSTLILKTDSLGNMIWSKEWSAGGGGMPSSTFFNSVFPSLDGGFALTGGYRDPSSGFDKYMFYKANNTGNLEWYKPFVYLVEPPTAIQNPDSNYIIAGTGCDTLGNQCGAVVYEISSAGSILNTYVFGNNDDDGFTDLTRTNDGGYIFTGWSYTIDQTKGNVVVLKTDSLFNMQWSKDIGGTGIDFGSEVIQTSDSGYLISGYTESFGFVQLGASYIIKLNGAGDTLWTKCFGKNGSDVTSYFSSKAKECSDGGFMIYSNHVLSPSYVPYSDLLKINSTGDSLWSQGFGKNYIQFVAEDFVKTSDGGYALLASLGPLHNVSPVFTKVDSLGQFGCPDQCVWQGDANYDGIVNNIDLLYIGVANDSIGTWRFDFLTDTESFSNSNVFYPTYSENWTQSFLNGVNYKHADCNGDGYINGGDVGYYDIMNYNLTHPLRPVQTIATGPEFYLDSTGLSVSSGSVVSIPIKLGTNASPANNFYGIAFTIGYDPTQVDTTYLVNVTFPSSWIGDNTNTFNLNRNFNSAGAIDVAVTRHNHQNVSGNGQIGLLNFKVRNDYSGPLSFDINNVTAMDYQTNIISVNPTGATIFVAPLGEEPLFNPALINVFPIPCSDKLSVLVRKQKIKKAELSIRDIFGRILLNKIKEGITDSDLEVLNIKSLNPGIYFLEVILDGESTIKQIVKQ